MVNTLFFLNEQLIDIRKELQPFTHHRHSRPRHSAQTPFSPLPNGITFSSLPSSGNLNRDPNSRCPHRHNPKLLKEQGKGTGGSTTAARVRSRQTGVGGRWVHSDPDKDPFLMLLEQLAENEQSRGGRSCPQTEDDGEWKHSGSFLLLR